MKYCYLFLLLFVFISCKKHLQKSEINKYKDTTVQRIHELKNERNASALLPFLKSENDIYRREAALAFASLQDNAAFKDLIILLRDPSAQVCFQAAYALGQLGNVEAESALITAIEKEKMPDVKAEMLESLGKICKEEGIIFISGLKSNDSIIKAGQAWALYRAGIRKLHSQEGIKLASELLDFENSENTRLGAAHFFARSPGLELSDFIEPLQKSATEDKSPFVRMAAAQAIAKTKEDSGTEILQHLFTNDSDYRVKINAIRTLQHFPAVEGFDFMLEAFHAGNDLTALAAAEYLLAKGSNKQLPLIEKLANETKNWRVKATLYTALIRFSSPEERIKHKEKLLALYDQSTSDYEKGYILKALSEDLQNTDLIDLKIFSSENQVIKTYAMEALVDMRKQREYPEKYKDQFQNSLIKAIETGDVALVGLAASIIREPALDFKNTFTKIEVLHKAQKKLVLPRDIEPYQELQRTIEYLNDSEEEKPIPTQTNVKAINWNELKKISNATIASIQTEKGTIEIQFLANEAPATVANFIELAKNGFYENKYFHRVVPNFVVQAGCPRGDGWGSTDYSIRSEFAPVNFGEGYIGMASAGKDTESCQWFITHSPTPHLDGRYTNFAKVISGMDVVHQLNIGDKIIKIQVKN